MWIIWMMKFLSLKLFLAFKKYLNVQTRVKMYVIFILFIIILFTS